MAIRNDMFRRELPYGKRYILPVVSSTAALVFLLVSAYTCKFVRIIRNDVSKASPFFMGIWKLEGGVQDGEGFPGNTNECIAWTDTPFYKDSGIRVAKLCTVVATFWATVGWVLILVGVFQPLQRILRTPILIGICACALLAVLFFCAFASELCDEDGFSCQFGAGAYMSCTAAILWITTAILLFQWTQREPSDAATSRDLVTVVTSHSTPTVPTGTIMSRQNVKFASRQLFSSSETSDTNTTGSKAEDTNTLYERHQRSQPVDLDEDLPPFTSMPWNNIDRGNLNINTIISREKDIADNDRSDTVSV